MKRRLYPGCPPRSIWLLIGWDLAHARHWIRRGARYSLPTRRRPNRQGPRSRCFPASRYAAAPGHTPTCPSSFSHCYSPLGSRLGAKRCGSEGAPGNSLDPHVRRDCSAKRVPCRRQSGLDLGRSVALGGESAVPSDNSGRSGTGTDMSGALRTDDLDLDAVRTPGDLADLLCQVRTRADEPSLRDLETRTRSGSTFVSKTVAGEVFGGTRFPRMAVMVALLDACGVQEGDLPPWRQVWRRLAKTRREAAQTTPEAKRRIDDEMELRRLQEQISELTADNERLPPAAGEVGDLLSPDSGRGRAEDYRLPRNARRQHTVLRHRRRSQ